MSGPYYYMPIPVDVDGNGPADADNTARIVHEVWDCDCATISTCYDEAMARWVADQLNRASTQSAYELAAQWHDKNARGCRDIADDYLRVGPDAARNAKDAAKHHAASAAGLRLAAIELRRKAIGAV